jgi:hypothetical protein
LSYGAILINPDGYLGEQGFFFQQLTGLVSFVQRASSLAILKAFSFIPRFQIYSPGAAFLVITYGAQEADTF